MTDKDHALYIIVVFLSCLFDCVYNTIHSLNYKAEACSAPVPCRWSANANGGALESLGYREGFRVDIDVPEGTWAEAPAFHDILIFNTGHW